jgi:hypothetical protein
MSDTVPDHIDLDSLTDDQVNALSPAEIEALMNQESAQEDVTPEPIEPIDDDDDDPADPNGEPDPEDDELENGSVAEEDADPVVPPVAPVKEELDPSQVADETGKQKAEENPAAPVKKAPDAEKTEKKTKEEPKPDAKDGAVDPSVAADFYAEITKPFKADGKDFTVKTPQEAIRLMQMGANYSRRMQEIKPLKAQDAMLREHGLHDPVKLSELIDISKGNPAAIQKLLKDKGIDPLDIDVSKPSEYKSPNYQANPKDLAFKDAIETTLAADGGRELITDMNQTWDEESKQALHESPTIFENMLAQKQTGVYSKINVELARQRTLGFLVDVPFLQAYHQVGDAMQKAGAFGKTEVQSEVVIAPVEKPAPTPIDTGTRKPALKKTEPANPILSSNPPSAASSDAVQNEMDYSDLSDEAFLKLGAPG